MVFVCLVLSGLEISFQEWFGTEKCEASSNFCVIFLAIRSHSVAGLSELVRYHTLSCPGSQKH